MKSVTPKSVTGQGSFSAEGLLSSAPAKGSKVRKISLVVSLVVHIVAIAVFVAMPRPEKEEKPIEVVFYTAPPEDRPEPPPLQPDPEPELPEPDPEPEPELPQPELPEPELPKPQEIVQEIPKPEPKPEPKPVEPPKPEPKPEPPKPKPVKPRVVKTNVFKDTPKETKPKPRERKLRTNTFADEPVVAGSTPRKRSAPRTNLLDSPTAKQAEPQRKNRTTRSSGFAQDDAPVTTNSRPVIATTSKTGSFEVVSNRRPEGEPRKRRGVSSSGFGSGEAADGPEPDRNRSVRNGGFGDAENVQAERKTRKKKVVLEREVRIVSKPKPVYTDEGRRLRVEGDVVLEVIFHADGTLKILRVVRGLGHGLDEAAEAAARGIDFEPARSAGKPIDFTATLRVVFQLA